MSDDNFRKPWRRKIILTHFEGIRVKFVYKGRVKVKVTGAKRSKIFFFQNVKLRSAITQNIRTIKFACSVGSFVMADGNGMMWPSSLSRDRKWPHVTKCTHPCVVGLRLEGNLATTEFSEYSSSVDCRTASSLFTNRAALCSKFTTQLKLLSLDDENVRISVVVVTTKINLTESTPTLARVVRPRYC